MRLSSIVTAALCTSGVLLWQVLTVHRKYDDNWTALYHTGAFVQAPPAAASEQIYRFGGAGFDGQFYHFIAHDPWLRLGSEGFVDNPRLRWRRILVPGLAWMLALGQTEFIDSAYFGVSAGFVLLGSYWLSRYCVRHNLPPAWGAAFLFVPAVLISMERGTVDVALAALCVGFALYADDSWLVYPVLALAPLARETGLCLVAAFVLVRLRERKWQAAGGGVLMAMPFVAWVLFLNAHTAPDRTVFASFVPLWGLAQRTLHPLQYAATSGWLRKAAALDYLAVLGIWVALVESPPRWFSFDALEGAALAFAAVAVFLAQPQAWAEAYAFGRTMSPLLVCVGLIAVARRRWRGLAPLAMVLPRILFQLWSEIKGA